MKKALRETQTLRALAVACSKVRTPPTRPLQTHKPTDRTDYNTLARSVLKGAKFEGPRANTKNKQHYT